MNPKSYTELLRIHDTIKKLQQLSWRSAQIEKRYPIQEVEDHEVESLIEAYKMLFEDFLETHGEFIKATLGK